MSAPVYSLPLWRPGWRGWGSFCNIRRPSSPFPSPHRPLWEDEKKKNVLKKPLNIHHPPGESSFLSLIRLIISVMFIPVYLAMLSSRSGYLVTLCISTGMMSLSCSLRHRRLLSASWRRWGGIRRVNNLTTYSKMNTFNIYTGLIVICVTVQQESLTEEIKYEDIR